MTDYQILNARQAQQQHPALCELLTACVAQGASVGFIDASDGSPISNFWHGVVGSISSGDKQLLVACEKDQIVGTVIVGLGMMPNGAHRAEISKLLVHPQARRRGIARQLMTRAEQIAIEAQRTLLVLDTRSGDTAEPLYLSLGWQLAGAIPDYALSTEGVLDATTIMYKRVG